MNMNELKNFKGYGTGWAFETGGKDIELDKFAVGKGYSIYIEHFGMIDPLVGELEGPFWYDYPEVFLFVIKSLGLEDKLKIHISDAYGISEDEYDSFGGLIDWIYRADVMEEIISDFSELEDKLIETDCAFGITDENYFIDLVLGFLDNYNDGTYEDYKAEALDMDLVTLCYNGEPNRKIQNKVINMLNS